MNKLLEIPNASITKEMIQNDFVIFKTFHNQFEEKDFPTFVTYFFTSSINSEIIFHKRILLLSYMLTFERTPIFVFQL
jgi:hypothetical protein